MKIFSLAIVGGGPSCTYVMERIAATAPDIREPFKLEIHLFEKTGEFGSGSVHSPNQPASSFLNRIAGQVGFAADESVAGAGPLLPRETRPTLYEWCRDRFAQTGDPAFDLGRESWPSRRVHGLALQHAFQKYLQLLQKHELIRVHLHQAEVVDVRQAEHGFHLTAAGPDTITVAVNHVLFVTGHSANDAKTSDTSRRCIDFAQRSHATYVPYAYPLEQMIPPAAVAPGKTVGIFGMGLTAIDVILYLTESCGGRFERDPASARLVYLPSGHEPSGIVPFGRTGLFTFARPFNAKEKDPTRLEHKPVFLTETAIDRLRRSAGKSCEVSPVGIQLQLDFEHDVFPLVLLEMANLHYTTLLGKDFGRFLRSVVQPAYEAFLQGISHAFTVEEAVSLLLSPIEAAVTEAFAEIERAPAGLDGSLADAPTERGWSLNAALDRYLFVVFGGETSRLFSPNGLSLVPEENRFSWQRLIQPIPVEECSTPDRYRKAILAFMDRDHRWAAQNNLDNPQKASVDGVWRDLRQVLAYAIDFGGLTADSHQKFLSVYMRHHNRLGNGAALEIMEKIQALAVHGMVDVSVGPRPSVMPDETSGCFALRGQLTGAERRLDTIIDAKIHTFDPQRDNSRLYRNMLSHGLIKKWRNPGKSGSYFEPGGLDLDANFHPIRADGKAEKNLTFLGPPSEGVMFFQLGALRPNQNHHVMRDIVGWIQGLWSEVARYCSTEGQLPEERVQDTGSLGQRSEATHG